jgi:2-oxoglutarate ferredoxin oxidoreductase subunit alpha
MVGQADMMQARWGSHGDYPVIALAPQSPQEAFDLVIDAFNLAETYRVPVMFMMDECVGHMTEKVVIPPADGIEIVPRHLTARPPGEYLPYLSEGGSVPEFARAGDGYRFHTTGLTHDEHGYPVMSPECQDVSIRRLVAKVRDHAEEIVRVEEDGVDGADVVVIAYGITARVARMAVEIARQEGLKVGFLRLVVVWPFPERRVRELAGSVKAFVVPEINLGQMVLEVERCAAGRATSIAVAHAGGGVHDPTRIVTAIVEAAK